MHDQSRIICRDLAAARRFYRAVARPLGLFVTDKANGFAVGRPDGAVLWVEAIDAIDRVRGESPETEPTHIALEAPDDFTVRAFYRACLEAGGRQLDYPAPQPTQGFRYYAAKVADPDGNCIECGWRH